MRGTALAVMSHRRTVRGGEVNMIKVYCDKCGKEVGKYEAYTILVQSPEIRAWNDEYLYDRKGYQICKDCIKKISDFITTNRNE